MKNVCNFELIKINKIQKKKKKIEERDRFPQLRKQIWRSFVVRLLATKGYFFKCGLLHGSTVVVSQFLLFFAR